jgi:membrane-bound serine protease (ClpP class)
LILFLAIQLARTRNAPVLTGTEKYIGQVANVYQDLAPRGRVWLDSQLWFAESRGQEQVPAKQPVRIVGVDGLTLIVEPVSMPAGRPAVAEDQGNVENHSV